MPARQEPEFRPAARAPMIGHDYFELREGTDEALTRLESLLGATGGEPAHIDLVRDLRRGLRDPIVLVAAGEVNAGKSTLLNALFGHEFCRTGVEPTTRRVRVFKFGQQERDVDVSGALVEAYRPLEFLRDFHLVDTPGTNSLVEEHEKITLQALPLADLILFVLPVVNPWGATAWNLLARIHSSWLKRVVLILQQCDLRSSEEVRAIREHLDLTVRQKFGAPLPVFPVSARTAFLARTSTMNREQLLEESGLAGLQDYISRVVTRMSGRLDKLANTFHAADLVFAEMHARLHKNESMLKADREILGALNSAATVRRDHTKRRFASLYQGIDNACSHVEQRGEESLRKLIGTTGVRFLLSTHDEKLDRLERQLRVGMVEAVRQHLPEAGQFVEDDLSHVWTGMSDGLERHFHLAMDKDGTSKRFEWENHSERVLARIESAARKEIARLDWKEDLARRLRDTRARLRLLLAGAGLALAAAAPAAILQPMPWLPVALTAAAGLAVGAIVYASRKSHHAVEALRDKIAEGHQSLKKRLRESYEEGVETCYADFLSVFEPMRELCENHRERYEPSIDKLKELSEIFNSLRTRLGKNPGN